MFMPMVWTNDFDDMMDPFDDWYDPFDDMISLIPTKDDVESAKSIERHARKEGKRYNRELRRQYNEMNRQFNEMNRQMKKRAMKTDVVDNGDHFTIKADLPGFDKKDIRVDLQNGVLTVAASHTENNDQKDEKSGQYIRRERFLSSYQRSFEVGEDVKPEDIQAQYENGVLTLTVPNRHPQIQQNDAGRIEVK